MTFRFSYRPCDKAWIWVEMCTSRFLDMIYICFPVAKHAKSKCYWLILWPGDFNKDIEYTGWRKICQESPHTNNNIYIIIYIFFFTPAAAVQLEQADITHTDIR